MEKAGRSWNDVLGLGSEGQQARDARLVAKDPLTEGASCGCLREEPFMGKGPDSKGPCFSVSPGDTGKTLPCGSTPEAWEQDLPQGPPRRTLLMAEGGEQQTGAG